MRKIYLIAILFVFKFGMTQSLLTVGEIYNYNIGDVFITQMGGISNPPMYIKQAITNKYYSPSLDTIFYTWNGYSYTSPGCPSCSPTYSAIAGATMSVSNLDYTVGLGLGSKIHYLSNNCIDTAGYTGTWVDTIFTSNCNISSIKISNMGNGPQLLDSCYSYFEPYYGYDIYGKGIGQVSHYYNTCSNGFTNCEISRTLIYFKKGMITCGSEPVIESIDELKLMESLAIFPNPTNSLLTLQTEEEFESIAIYNTIGETCSYKPLGSKSIEISDLPDGIYYLKVKTTKGLVRKKFVKE